MMTQNLRAPWCDEPSLALPHPRPTPAAPTTSPWWQPPPRAPSSKAPLANLSGRQHPRLLTDVTTPSPMASRVSSSLHPYSGGRDNTYRSMNQENGGVSPINSFFSLRTRNDYVGDILAVPPSSCITIAQLHYIQDTLPQQYRPAKPSHVRGSILQIVYDYHTAFLAWAYDTTVSQPGAALTYLASHSMS
jgi:hypothetical protein